MQATRHATLAALTVVSLSGPAWAVEPPRMKMTTDIPESITTPDRVETRILILRDDRSPGAEHGRPLIRADTGLWEIYDGYPFAGPHLEPGAP